MYLRMVCISNPPRVPENTPDSERKQIAAYMLNARLAIYVNHLTDIGTYPILELLNFESLQHLYIAWQHGQTGRSEA